MSGLCHPLGEVSENTELLQILISEEAENISSS